MVAITGELVRFVATNAAILPAPLAARPIEGALFVQLYTIVPPVVGLLKVTAVVVAPLHNSWLATAVTVAVGLTVIVNVVGVPVHVVPPFVYDGVTVIVAVTGAVVAFVAVNEAILPEPL